MPHILILPSWYTSSYNPARGIFFFEQAVALEQSGVRVGVICPDRRSWRSVLAGDLWKNRFQITCEEEQGIPTLRWHGWNLPTMPRLGGRLWIAQALRLFDRYVERFGRPDLIHAHSVLWGGVAAHRLHQSRGVPYLITEHASTYARGMIQPWQRASIEAALGDASRILAVSRALAEQLRPYAADATIEIVPNVIDTDFFTLPLAPREAQPFRFLAISGFVPNKGVDLLLQAFAAAFAGREEVRLEIGGDGPQRRALGALAAELGVAGQVTFLGRLSRHEVRAAMWRANVFVLPSLVETFGVVLIEAMATGLPVLASRSGGPAEIVDDTVGWLVEPGSIAELADGLRRAHAEAGAAAGREVTIRHSATKRFGRPAVVRQLLACYDAVLGGNTQSDRRVLA